MNKPYNLVYQLYYKYLCFAISMFESDCYHNLNDIIPFSQSENTFIGDGINGSFIIEDALPSGANFYISVDNISSGYSYTYEEVTKTVTITPVPNNLSDVYIVWYIIGSFSDTLTIQEMDILSSGMLIPWQQEQLNRNNLLQQAVYSSDFKMNSQAEHIKQLNVSIDNQYWKNVKSKINEYSFKYNPNLNGLGGGLT